MTVEFRGRPLVGHAVAAALAAPVDRVIVVVGQDPSVRAAVAPLQTKDALLIIEAPDAEHGMSRSLKAGLEALPSDARGAFIFLGDMPFIPHGVAGELAAALLEGAAAAAPVHGGRRGHPALLGPEAISVARRLDGDVGARSVLDALGDRLALVPAAAGVLFDVDRPEDLSSA